MRQTREILGQKRKPQGGGAEPSNCSSPNREQHPDGHRYIQFCEFSRRWLQPRSLSMRHVHRAGEKCFVDYVGIKPTIIDSTSAEVIEVELFVAVPGASELHVRERRVRGIGRSCP